MQAPTACRTPPNEIKQPDQAGDGHCHHQQQSKIHNRVVLVVHLEYGEESVLGDLYPTHLFHALLARFLFFKQLFLARYVAAITLGRHVLAQRLDRGASHYLAPDGGLYRHVEHLPWYQLLHLVHQHPATGMGMVTVDDDCQSIDTLIVDQYIKTYQLGRLETLEVVVQRCIAT